MAFVKLDTGVLDSTLWVDRPVREMFITALLMAEPFELTEPAEALQVRAIEPSGFTVPAGWYGFVRAAGIGIVNRALLDQETGMAALERLGNPDPESRSEDYDGRRLVRINGGFIVLNYFRYRDRDHTAAERQRRMRERRRNAVTLRDSDVTSHIADADADADAEKKKKESKSAHAKREREQKADELASRFEEIRMAYPQRGGGQRWKDAERAYHAQLASGVTHEEIMAGVSRYAQFMRITGKVGTEFVQQAATFLGRNAGFKEPWTAPNQVQDVRQVSAIDRVRLANQNRESEDGRVVSTQRQIGGNLDKFG